MHVHLSPSEVPTDPVERRDWILHRLHERGLTYSDLSRQHGFASQLSQVASRPWLRAEAIVAEALGLKPHELFPERYDAAGRPRGYGRNRSRAPAIAHLPKPGHG